MSPTAISTTFSTGATTAPGTAEAFEEIDNAISFSTADAAILFVSSEYDLSELASILRERVAVPILCCTTAGEISSAFGYSSGGMVGAAIRGCSASVLDFPTSKLADSAVAELIAAHADLTQWMAGTQEEAAQTAIGLLAVDGVCRCEEAVIGKLQSALPGIPIVGGSAGDALRFARTFVYQQGEFRNAAGSLLLVRGGFSAIPFQTHHFTDSGERTVATEVDTASRRLIQLDGKRVTKRLAELMNCSESALTVEKLATRSLMIRFGDITFVRAVQSINDDGSLTMFCAINRGDVLHFGKAGGIVDTTASYFEALKNQNRTPDLVIGFDCILRRLELAMRGRTQEMNGILRQVPFVGFSTFGEQCLGQHVNQTMTGVALWSS